MWVPITTAIARALLLGVYIRAADFLKGLICSYQGDLLPHRTLGLEVHQIKETRQRES